MNSSRSERMVNHQPYRAKESLIIVARKPLKPSSHSMDVPSSKPAATTASIPMNKATGSILSRLGSGASAGPSGTSVTFSSLNPDIRASDIAELCGTIGETRKVEMLYDNKGKAKGAAEVVFVRRSEALDCVKKFHNLALDNRPMVVALTGTGGKENPFSPSTEVAPVSQNNRGGLFGTHLQDAEDDTSSSEEDFNKAHPIIRGRGGRGGERGRGRGGSRVVMNRGGGGGGSRGGRGSDFGVRGGGRTVVDAADLDKELDNYMSKK